jgi:ubiquinone/menaquinone biosynthesis C-methylase UbiE
MTLPRAFKPIAFAILRALPAMERRVLPSAGYRRIDRAEAERLQAKGSGWTSGRSAAWQQRAYDALLEDMAAGRPRQDLAIAADAVDAAGISRPSLLEVGCGGGYHSAIFGALCRSGPDYLGSDYSQDMIESARGRFPGIPFEVADTTALPYADNAFDIVFEGVSLMHILDYRNAIAEIARVARSHAIFHCVPIFEDHNTEYLFKYAYGEPVTEAVYRRAELEEALAGAGLVIERSWEALAYDVHPHLGVHSHSRTYLCRKSVTPGGGAELQ